MLDLNKLEKQLDETLAKETPERLREFLMTPEERAERELGEEKEHGMIHLRMFGSFLILLGFTALLLTDAIDWTQIQINPRATWTFLCGFLMGIGIIFLAWRKICKNF